jgi:anion-transporting  ArsA/GET3 family ATPase
MNPRSLDLPARRLVVCLGPGGVGKTTLSAALAVHGATAGRGRAVDVMTVDPAPRLLDALGLVATGAGPHEVPLGRVAPMRARAARAAGVPPARLRALRLDPKTTFDSIVARHAPSKAARAAILDNRIYHNLSNALAGVADYMAMEKLLELSNDPATELIVLDTPPASEALDFLDAPRRMLELMNSRAISLLSAPSGIFRSRLRVVDLAARAVLAAFDRVTGLNMLADVHSFVQSFDGMYQGFADRAKAAAALLRAPGTAIVMVTTAEAARVEQAREFVAALERAGLGVAAMVVNRVMEDLPDAEEIAAAKISPALKRKLRRNLADFGALKEREAISLSALRATLPEGAALMVMPELDHEPRAIADLAELGSLLRTV